MPYRNKPMHCPRCGKQLVRYEQRDKWRCKECTGALVGGEQLEVELGDFAKSVLDGDADPRRPAIHPCPYCAYPMTPYTIELAALPGEDSGREEKPLRGIELDRCVDDRVVWFDGGEIGRVRDAIAPTNAEQPSLFTNALGFVAALREQTQAMRAGKLDEIPLAEPLEIKPGEWEARKNCGDGACNGVIGDDGKCKECGRAA